MTDLVPAAGWIGLVKVQGLVGDAIHLAQELDGDGDAPYEHAFVVVNGGMAADVVATAQVIEAEPGGCRLAPLREYRGRQVLWIPCPAQYQDAMIKAALGYLHTGYSYADYVAIAAHHLGIDPLHVGEWLVKMSGHEVCSMLAVSCAQTAGWPLVPAGVWAGYVTPGRLAQYAPSAVPQLVA